MEILMVSYFPRHEYDDNPGKRSSARSGRPSGALKMLLVRIPGIWWWRIGLRMGENMRRSRGVECAVRGCLTVFGWDFDRRATADLLTHGARKFHVCSLAAGLGLAWSLARSAASNEQATGKMPSAGLVRDG